MFMMNNSSDTHAELQAEYRNIIPKNPTMRDMHQYAETLIANGYHPLFTHRNERRPLGAGWNHRIITDPRASFGDYTIDAGLAVATGVGGLVGFDIDADDPAIDEKLRAAGILSPVARRGSKGYALFFRYVENEPLMSITEGKIELHSWKHDNRGKTANGLVTGSLAIPPTWHGSVDRPYMWLGSRTLFNTRLDELPILTRATVESVFGQTRIPANESREVATTKLNGLHEYALREAEKKAQNLSTMRPNSGRNRALYDAVAYLGKFFHHQAISLNELCEPLYRACEANGLVREDNIGATIDSALKASQNDPLPEYLTNPFIQAQHVVQLRPLRREIPPATDFIVDQLIPDEKGIVITLGGQTRAGKTSIAAMITAAVASGRPCLGLEVDRPGEVIFVPAEGGAQIDLRIVTALSALGATNNHAPIWIDDMNALLGGMMTCQIKPRLLIIDSLATALGIKDHNNPAETAAAMERLRQLSKALGCPILLLAHFGKNQEVGLSGSHQITAQSDVVINAVLDGAEVLEGTIEGRRLTISKTRYGVEGPLMNYDIQGLNLGQIDRKGRVVLQPYVVLVEGNGKKQSKLKRSISLCFGNLKTMPLVNFRNALKLNYNGEEKQAFYNAKRDNLIIINNDFVSINFE